MLLFAEKEKRQNWKENQVALEVERAQNQKDECFDFDDFRFCLKATSFGDICSFESAVLR